MKFDISWTIKNKREKKKNRLGIKMYESHSLHFSIFVSLRDNGDMKIAEKDNGVFTQRWKMFSPLRSLPSASLKVFNNSNDTRICRGIRMEMRKQCTDDDRPALNSCHSFVYLFVRTMLLKYFKSSKEKKKFLEIFNLWLNFLNCSFR